MKCSSCGGELYFEKGNAICKSCKSTYKIDSIFENTEVCLCYIENDENGRRTKDSLIAQEVYQNLESKKITTFFERVSADDVIGDDLELLRCSAIDKSKVVIVVGASKAYFEVIVEKYADLFADKKIIPVFSNMAPTDIPQSINKIQALNYDSIGWNVNLIKGVLNILGRENEIELEKVYSKHKTKKILAVVFPLICVLVIGIVLFFVLGKNSQAPTNQQIYEQAQKATEEGKYIDAAELYYQIIDYKNSKQLLSSIYDKYDGYYLIDKENVSLTLNISGINSASIIVKKRDVNNKVVSLEESVVITKAVFEFDFIDTQTNTGNVKVQLLNNAIRLSVNTTTINSELNMGNFELEFPLSSKTDASIDGVLTHDLVTGWLEKPTSVTSLRDAGYELTLTHAFDVDGENTYFVKVFRIEDQNITIMCSNFDLSKTGEYFSDISQYKLDDEIICAVIVSADIALPDEIGNVVNFKETDSLFFMPHITNFSELTHNEGIVQHPGDVVRFLFDDDKLGTPLQSDTLVGVASKTMVGDALQKDSFLYYIDHIVYRPKVEAQFEKDYGSDKSVYADFVTESKNNKLYCIEIPNEYNPTNIFHYPNYYYYDYYYYSINKTTYATKFLICIENVWENSTSDEAYGTRSHRENLLNDPEFFGEFIKPKYNCKSCSGLYEILDEKGFCEGCADGICNTCGGTAEEGHNCDDYPNVFCPNCGWGIFLTGWAFDEFPCGNCGTNFDPFPS